MLHRYRSNCHLRLGSHALALSDARHAVALNPKGSSNLFVAARALQHSAAMATDTLDKRQRHSEAVAAAPTSHPHRLPLTLTLPTDPDPDLRA